MFTGIIQGVGRVADLQASVLRISAPPEFGTDFELGESIAVNGCCLTVVEIGPLAFDVSPETFAKTAFHSLKLGDRVNLERALRAGARLGGHIVQGHVDGVGHVTSIRAEGNALVMQFQGPPEFDRYLVDKGSVTVDGISLTVVSPQNGAFDVWVIPHTLENTRLGDLIVGSPVNLEFDVLAKHLEKLALPYLIKG